MLTFVLKPLVGSILDSVALSRRLDIPVVTLPDWSNLHPDHLPFLDQFETIFLWFNNDVQGSQNSRLFAQKIEEKRCRLVSSHYPGPVMSVRRKMDIKVERVSWCFKNIFIYKKTCLLLLCFHTWILILVITTGTHSCSRSYHTVFRYFFVNFLFTIYENF